MNYCTINWSLINGNGTFYTNFYTANTLTSLEQVNLKNELEKNIDTTKCVIVSISQKEILQEVQKDEISRFYGAFYTEIQGKLINNSSMLIPYLKDSVSDSQVLESFKKAFAFDLKAREFRGRTARII